MTARERLDSYAVIWQDLASDLLFAIDRLETMNRKAPLGVLSRAILFSIAEDLQSIRLNWCDTNGQPLPAIDQEIRLDLLPLPEATDETRTEPMFAPPVIPPNGSIDRAISKAAAEMMSYSKDPETYEVLEHERFRLFLRWGGGEPALVYQFAYGLWDE